MPYCCINHHANAAGSVWCSECGSLVEGASVHDCSIISYIGEGSFSIVYLARQRSLNNRKVVIKMLRQRESQPSVSDFRREAAVLAALSHPYILPIYAYGIMDQHQLPTASYSPYLVLPYAEQGSLEEAFVREGNRPWSLKRVVAIVEEAADALDYAHERGVLHRDIKPANLLLMGSHTVLADFGVASLIDADTSHVEAGWAGSPAFMAPEVWQFRPGRYSDQYALAVTCFRLLTGEYLWLPPQDGSTRQWSRLHRMVAPRSLRSLRPDLPSPVDLVLQQALAKDPHERYRSVKAFAADLRVASQDDTQVLTRRDRIPAEPKPPAPQPVLTEVHAAPLAVQTDAKRPRQTDQVPVLAQVTPAPVPPKKPLRVPDRSFLYAVTGSLGSLKENGNWFLSALLLNLFICLVLAAQKAWAAGQITASANPLLAFWPALFTGLLVARWFQRLALHSLSWGVFWGMLFGIVDALISALVCFTWTALGRTFLFHWGRDWQVPGQGWSLFLLEAQGLFVPDNLRLFLMALWIAVVGGALIGLLHAWAQRH